MEEEALKQIWLLRRMVSMVSADANHNSEATEKVLERLKKTSSNEEFLVNLGKDTQFGVLYMWLQATSPDIFIYMPVKNINYSNNIKLWAQA